jgi:hypothetical protein
MRKPTDSAPAAAPSEARSAVLRVLANAGLLAFASLCVISLTAGRVDAALLWGGALLVVFAPALDRVALRRGWLTDRIDTLRWCGLALAVAGAALYLANASDAQIVTMGTEMYGRALERMSRDARTAMAMTDYPRAANLVRQAARRERRSLESLGRFATPGGTGEKAMKALLQQLPTEDNAEMRLAAYVTGTTGTKPAPFASRMTAREKELAGMVPSVSVSIKDFLDKSSQVKKPASLHSLMAYEIINFVDGVNSYLDIFRAVSAEADSAGDWYFGTVSLEDVAAYLDSARAAGIITVVPKAPAKGTR